MEEVKIHTGSRIRLNALDESALPREFLSRLQEYAHHDEKILAIYLFALQAETQSAQPSIALAIKSGMFSKKDENFLQVVDEIQLMLPEDLSLNLYRFGASDFLAKYCIENLEPVYLRSSAWVEKQRKKYSDK